MESVRPYFKLLGSLFLAITLAACGQSFTTTHGQIDLGSENGQDTEPPVVVIPPDEDPETPELPDLPEAFNLFTDVAVPIAQSVDGYYSNYRELLVQRSVSSHRSDTCDANLNGKFTFADRIAYYVNKNMEPRSAKLAFIGDLFSMPSVQSQILPNSITSHAWCPATKASLTATIGASRVPSDAVIAKINTLTNRFNEYRTKMRAGDVRAKVDMTKLVTKMMMCLSYVESLTTADSSAAERIAAKYAPEGYRRPAGVNFYEDPLQTPESRLNIGLFQFTPTAGGNINPCLKQWNEIYPSCQIATNSSQAEMIKVVGSAYQTFNAFCGSNKLSQMFSVQINTKDSTRTHPLNKMANGSLKPAGERCVTMNFAGKSYNHFGPFQNGSGENLNELLTCTLAQ